MKSAVIKKSRETKEMQNRRFDPFYLITDEEFCTNLREIVACYEAIKTENKVPLWIHGEKKS